MARPHAFEAQELRKAPAAALMLEHAERADRAKRMRDAIDTTVHDDNVRTRDLGGSASTKEFADAVVRRARLGLRNAHASAAVKNTPSAASRPRRASVPRR